MSIRIYASRPNDRGMSVTSHITQDYYSQARTAFTEIAGTEIAGTGFAGMRDNRA